MPVVCLLQDEDGFLDGLSSPYAEQAWGMVRERARDIDAFLAVSKYYADAMSLRLGVARGADARGPHGSRAGRLRAGRRRAGRADDRLSLADVPGAGFGETGRCLHSPQENEKLRSAKLRICGGRNACDEPFLARLRDKLAAAGVLADVDFLPSLTAIAKLEFLRSLSVLSVPEEQAGGVWAVCARSPGDGRAGRRAGDRLFSGDARDDGRRRALRAEHGGEARRSHWSRCCWIRRPPAGSGPRAERVWPRRSRSARRRGR